MINNIILKIKKRLDYFLAKRKSIETYYMLVEASSLKITTFNYYGFVFRARLKNSSDYDMVQQVLIKEEYRTAISFFLTQSLIPQIIIDAGSNIGTTAVYLKHIFPSAKIFCIEPDKNNFSLLSSNLSPYIIDGSVKLFKAGLMAKSGLSLNIYKNFRDNSSCARQVVVSTEETLLKSITIQDIIQNGMIETIDFLKIDIEGAETFLLEKDVDLSFLKITKCIAIEIHDEYGCREGIYSLLRRNNYLLLEDNETTIALNKSYF